MKKYYFMVLSMMLVVLFSFLFVRPFQSQKTITYFPIDHDAQFSEAKTTITPSKNNQKLIWKSKSTSNKTPYLRQDVSLLFANGQLIGASSKWQEHVNSITLQKTFPLQNQTLYQAITFHYGEIHPPNQDIESMDHMSFDQLFVTSSKKGIHTFHTAQTAMEQQAQNDLSKHTTKRLIGEWKKLMNHFQLKQEDYTLIPLNTLSHYQNKPLPHHSQEETDIIIARLWEGIYKNYILPITKDNPAESSLMPIILLAHDGSHLRVLYHLNGEAKQLIQQIVN